MTDIRGSADTCLKRAIPVGLVLILVLSAACRQPPQAGVAASPISGEAPLTVTFANSSENADEYRWDFGDGTAATSSEADEPVTHEYIRAGNHTASLTAIQAKEPPITNTATVNIEVRHGALIRVTLLPARVELNIGERVDFTAEASDEYGNPVLEATFTWEVMDVAGTIADDGTFTAGTQAGDFEQAVVVTAALGAASAEATAAVEIAADPLDLVSISPISVGAGESQQLEAFASDGRGNRLSDVSLLWTIIDATAGSVTEEGLFTAGPKPGSYSAAVEVEATQGETTRTVTALVAVTAGPLAKVFIAPDRVAIGMEMDQQFVAVGADRYGNRISGLQFTWSAEDGAGTVSQAGLFTAGTTPGVHNAAVEVEAAHGGATRSATARVTVEPDRIAFSSDRNDDQSDLYIMTVDGTDTERLTTTPSWEAQSSWSPDGHRLAFDSWNYNAGILVMNDDGDRVNLLYQNDADAGRIYVFPAWSPDGSKIVFIGMTVLANDFEDLDIFVMDVDGGNVTQLTDTGNGDEWVASWSPDGTELAYDFTPTGREGDIYIMNADGSERRQLTSDPANDTDPVWSPDGTEIAFISERDGDYEIYLINADGTDLRQLTSNVGIDDSDPDWSPDGTRIVFSSDRATRGSTEIYVMNADGSDVTRLTDNTADDDDPQWAPRKSGVPVTAASITVPVTETPTAMTVQEVTAGASDAVVRIETDLGSGSGFIISSGGLIMTNNHVIREAEEITVYLKDGTSYTATVKARDLLRDLALIEIEATGLPYLQMGGTSDVGLGQQVVVLGYPLGTENLTVTSGLISAIDYDPGRNIAWLQTDSAVNPGNSGGPLLNLQGRVVGVVSAKIVGVDVEGIGFAISSDTVNLYLTQLKAGETITSY